MALYTWQTYGLSKCSLRKVAVSRFLPALKMYDASCLILEGRQSEVSITCKAGPSL